MPSANGAAHGIAADLEDGVVLQPIEEVVVGVLNGERQPLHGYYPGIVFLPG
jgi:hypothetical protein|tara:strand:- start:491 stop:646 length:156 start_codon:yes stop_codon:yes gene_type:complete